MAATHSPRWPVEPFCAFMTARPPKPAVLLTIGGVGLVPSNLLLSHRLRRDPQFRDPCWRQTRDTGSIHPSRLGASLGASRRGRLRRGRAERHPAGAAAVRTARPRPGAVRGATTPRHPGIGTVDPGIDQPPSRGRTCSYGHLPTGRCPMGRQVACAAATVPPTRHHSDLRPARAVRWVRSCRPHPAPFRPRCWASMPTRPRRV